MLFKDKLRSPLKFKRKKKSFTFSRRKYSNPYFPRRKNRRWPSILSVLTWRGKLIIGACFILLICFVWLGIFSPLLKIKDVKIEIITNVKSEIPPDLHLSEPAIRQIVNNRLTGKIFRFLPEANLLLFDTEALGHALKSNFYFKGVSVVKKPFHTLVVRLVEEEYVFIWQEKGKNYFADSQGNIIKEIDQSEIDQKKFLLVINQSVDRIVDNILIKYDDLYKIFDIYSGLRQNSAYQIENFLIGEELNTIKVKTTAGTVFFFSLKEGDNPISQQITKLNRLIKEKLNNRITGLDYIDLRYGNRINYK